MVGDRGEPGQSLVVDQNAQRVQATEEHIDSEVPFEPVDEVGVLDVFLDNLSVIVKFQILEFGYEVDALSLTGVFGLDDKDFGFVHTFLFEFFELAGQAPGFREEIEIAGEELL